MRVWPPALEFFAVEHLVNAVLEVPPEGERRSRQRGAQTSDDSLRPLRGRSPSLGPGGGARRLPTPGVCGT
jgi:hypothetical protein